MAIKFKELKQYISRVVRISVCYRDGHYDNYSLISDIPDGRYDDFYIYGIGMVDVEFSLDVYSNPKEETSENASTCKDIFLGCGLEIVIHEEPRKIERCNDKELCFGDLRNYLQWGKNFSIVMREDWSSEEYEWRRDIPQQYDDLFVYGIGMEDNPKEVDDLRYRGIDSQLMKRLVIVLSKTPRKDVREAV